MVEGRGGRCWWRSDPSMPEGDMRVAAGVAREAFLELLPSGQGTNQRVLPTQFLKPTKVAVSGAQQQPMLDGQRRQVGVRDQVCLYTGGSQERFQNIGVPLGRLWNPDRVGFEPGADLAPSFGCGRGALEHARVRDNAQKGQEAWPRQTYGPAATQFCVKPIARLCMLRKGVNVGIDE